MSEIWRCDGVGCTNEVHIGPGEPFWYRVTVSGINQHYCCAAHIPTGKVP